MRLPQRLFLQLCALLSVLVLAPQAAATTEEEEEQPFSLEESADDATGWLNGKLSKAIFYDVGGDEFEAEVAGAVTETTAAELLAALEQSSEGSGVDLDYAALSFTLPCGTTEEVRAAVEAAITAGRTDEADPDAPRYKSLTVEVAAPATRLYYAEEAYLVHEGALEAVSGEPLAQHFQDLAREQDLDLASAPLRLVLPAGTSDEVRVALAASLASGLAEGGGGLEVELDAPITALAAAESGIPLAVLWLILGAIFFTVRMGFINIRGFWHAINVTRGRYDNPEDEGEVTHFQALASALSATVGLGNIAGVAIAISIGGPGATIWMIAAGVLGMSSKFVECTLGQKYRSVRADGRVMGGAMYYLSAGLKEMHLGPLGKVLAILFVIMCIGGSFGGGNTFQVNQSLNAISETFTFFSHETKVDSVQAETSGATVSELLARMDTQAVGADIDLEKADLKLLVPEGTTKAARASLLDGLTPVLKNYKSLSIVVPVGEDAVSSMTLAAKEPANHWVYGLVMTLLVGIVIIGGIKRIAATAEKIVPFMCGIYVLGCIAVILLESDRVVWAFEEIVRGAFDSKAMYGGLIGVLVTGFKRAAFSNEAGVGSAAIAHSAAKTDYPVREGIVALMGPFIDTVVVCTMTALVIVITGAYDGVTHPEFQAFIDDANGAALTSAAFGSVISWFPYVLSVSVVLFAYSTMISWSYYGERCWAYVFGDSSSLIYRILFLVFVFLGSLITSQNVLDFGDLMILGMAFPNILGVVLLSGKVRRDLDKYWAMYKGGEFKTYK